MLFETRDGSVALIIFSLQIFWLSLILPLTAMLQGAGKVKVPTFLLIGGLDYKNRRKSTPCSYMGCRGSGNCRQYRFRSNYVRTNFYFKKVWPIRLAPTRFYGWVLVATALMIAVVLPWLIVADGFLFDNLPSRLSATLIALTSVSAGAAVFLFVIMKSRIMAEKEWFLCHSGNVWLHCN